MKINAKKTKIIPFNFTRNFDFIPKLSIDERPLEVEYSTKLLGVVIQSDCKRGANTKYIITKAKKRVWFLRRLKLLGASQNTLLDLFRLFIRSVLEMGVPLWAGALTQKNKKEIESVQHSCIKLIFGSKFITYEQALKKTGLETLAARRDKLCVKFAKKCTSSIKFKNWFQEKVSLKT